MVEVERPRNGQAADFRFATELLPADAYSVIVATQPPGHRCTALNAQGRVIQGVAPTVVVSCVPVFDDATYTIGGRIDGLEGEGLTLALNNGQQTFEVAPEANRFVFPGGVLDDTAWEVSVQRQPQGPTQDCRVEDGIGVVDGAHEEGVRVRCVDASQVSVDLFWPPSDGSRVQAFLVDEGGHMVGREPQDARLNRGRALFTLQAPNRAGAAALAEGRFLLWIFVDHDNEGSPGSLTPAFRPGVDLGRLIPLRLLAGRPHTEVIRWSAGDEARLPPLDEIELVVDMGGEDPSGELICWWAPSGLELPIPPGRDPPVISTTRVLCQGDACVDGGNLVGVPRVGLPNTIDYGVTCWIDQDGDGQLSDGDLRGHQNSDGDDRVVVRMRERN